MKCNKPGVSAVYLFTCLLIRERKHEGEIHPANWVKVNMGNPIGLKCFSSPQKTSISCRLPMQSNFSDHCDVCDVSSNFGMKFGKGENIA